MYGIRIVAAILLIGIATGCQSRPQLKQVAEDAAAKPINAPDAAVRLKQQHEK